MAARDIVTIAGSAGSMDEISKLLRYLPASFAGSLFIVVHTSAEGPGLLAEILGRASRLPVGNPHHGESIKLGRVYVARPNHHLLILPGRIELGRGPRENRFRPAADPLFRSAAQSYGPRVVGIVLSGGLEDATLGLKIIKQHGGIAIVQEPSEAMNPSMPNSAIQNVNIDYVMPVRAMPRVLMQLSGRKRKGGPDMDRRKKQQMDSATSADLAQALDGPPSG